MSKISIVVPVYNAGAKLKKSIQSILKQNFTDFELILVNDGSTDGSAQVCDRFAETDSRIHVIHQQNQGSVAARKAGVEECSGEFLASAMRMTSFRRMRLLFYPAILAMPMYALVTHASYGKM